MGFVTIIESISMKKTLLLLTLTGTMATTGQAAHYDKLSTPFCDEKNHIIYDGQGRFAVQSAAETTLKITINVGALENYLGSNDYAPSSFIAWTCNTNKQAISYGLRDTSKGLTCHWLGKEWNQAGILSYSNLKKQADEQGLVTLILHNSPTKDGLSIRSEDGKTLYHAKKLASSIVTGTSAYTVNLNYVTAVDIQTDSTLDTSTYEPPKDYKKAFVKTKDKSIGRVIFCGDSITHGVRDASYRWQIFKIWLDNDIEHEIVGPRSGYYSKPAIVDPGDTYAGKSFPNVHLAQASGRTHNILKGSNAGMSGVNYGGHSTSSTADNFNGDTFFCLMGTNDLLSDAGYTPEKFTTKMQNLLGGQVQSNGGRYTRSAGRDWGNMGKIATDLLRDKGDILYVLSVPTWGRHANNNEAERHAAVQSYNKLLKDWVKQFAKAEKLDVRYVEVNRGMVDSTATVFTGNDSFFNIPGADGLHPNEQGSILMANNVAQAMGIPGRSAGLPRANARGWDTPDNAIFSGENGSSLHFLVDIKKPGKAATITIPSAAGSGTLSLSSTHITWGDKVLLCPDDSFSAKTPVRIVNHPGNKEHNIPAGFYIWLEGQLIGQALPVLDTNNKEFNMEEAGRIKSVKATNKALAPAKSSPKRKKNKKTRN